MTAIARTATGLEGALLIDANGALVTSAAMMFGEMREFLVPPEPQGYWVQLDGSKVDPNKHPKLYAKLKELPKFERKWVYAG
jgi:hypothetical protein